jgi:hypothetical protein
MTPGKRSEAPHELSREDIEALVWRGRELHSQALREGFAETAAAVRALYDRIVRLLASGGEKLIRH